MICRHKYMVSLPIQEELNHPRANRESQKFGVDMSQFLYLVYVRKMAQSSVVGGRQPGATQVTLGERPASIPLVELRS